MEDTQKDVVEATPTEQVAATPAAPAADTPKSGGATKWIIAVLVIAALAGGAYYYFTQKDDAANEATAVSGIEIPDGPVVRVNGEEVSGEEYAAAVNELAQAATAQGMSLEDAEVQGRIKDEALLVLINTELLMQEAAKAGITTSQDAVATEYAALETQLGGEAALASALTAYGLTKEELQKNISTQLTIQSYLSETLDVAVTDEEVQALYDQVAASGTGELPPLADIRAEVEAQVRATKEQPLIEELIASLREEAEIEVLI